MEFRKYSFSVLVSGGGLVASLATAIFLARSMGPSDYGLLVLSMSIVLLPASFVDLGVGVSTPIFLARCLGAKNIANARKILFDTALFSTVVAILFFLLMLLLLPSIVDIFSMPGLYGGLQAMIYFIPSIFIQRWGYSALNGLGYNLKKVYLDRLFGQLITLIIALYAWTHFETVEAVVAAYGVSMSITGFVACLIGMRACLKIDRGKLKAKNEYDFWHLIRHGIPLNLSSVVDRLFKQGDVLIIGLLLSETAVGIYSAAFKLVNGVKQLTAPISAISAFNISKSIGEKNDKLIFLHYRGAVLANLFFTGPIYFFLSFEAKNVLKLIYGAEFISGSVPLQILAIGFSVFVCIGPLGALLSALEMNWIRVRVMTFLTALNLVMNYFLVRYFGLEGASMATSMCFLLLYIAFSRIFPSKDQHFVSPIIILSIIFTLNLIGLKVDETGLFHVLYLVIGMLLLAGVVLMCLNKEIVHKKILEP
jgi:O-antigen/teichoic acid export membrane protein